MYACRYVSRSISQLAALLCCLVTHLCWANELTPRLGRVIPADQAAAMIQPVFADGRGLPTGSGTAPVGARIYQLQCEGCHGKAGRGGSAMELLGDRSLLATEYPDKGINVYWPYAPALFSYIQRAMPPQAPFTLSDDDTYAVIAYLFLEGNLISENQIVDKLLLSTIELPNRSGFDSQVPH